MDPQPEANSLVGSSPDQHVVELPTSVSTSIVSGTGQAVTPPCRSADQPMDHCGSETAADTQTIQLGGYPSAAAQDTSAWVQNPLCTSDARQLDCAASIGHTRCFQHITRSATDAQTSDNSAPEQSSSLRPAAHVSQSASMGGGLPVRASDRLPNQQENAHGTGVSDNSIPADWAAEFGIGRAGRKVDTARMASAASQGALPAAAEGLSAIKLTQVQLAQLECASVTPCWSEG